MCLVFCSCPLSLMDPCSLQGLASTLLPTKPFFDPAFHDSAPLLFQPHSAWGKRDHFLTIMQNYLQVLPMPRSLGWTILLCQLVSCYPTGSLPSEWFPCEISAPPGTCCLTEDPGSAASDYRGDITNRHNLNFWAVEYETQGFVRGKHSFTTTKQPSHDHIGTVSYMQSTTDKNTCRSDLHGH